MIRRVVADSSPLPHVVEEGRQRLLHESSPWDRKTRTGTIGRAAARRAAALGLTGAVALSALVVATLVPGVGTSPRRRGSTTIEGSPRDVLLAAAVQAESAPTSGTYWHVRSMFTRTWPNELGSGDHRYTVEHTTVTEEWTKRSGQTWRGWREWVEPKNSDDEAAWRRDGSPSKWCVQNSELPEPFCLHTAPGTASITRMEDDAVFLTAEEHELTFEELQRLPQDPDALRAWATEVVREVLDGSASADLVDYSVAGVLADLLVDVPVPSDVRAAAYRALADMPNVTSTGPTEDALGRDGIGILIGADDVTGFSLPDGEKVMGFTRRLIVDAETSYVLADGATGDQRSDEGALILDVGWTDEEPREPALP